MYVLVKKDSGGGAQDVAVGIGFMDAVSSLLSSDDQDVVNEGDYESLEQVEVWHQMDDVSDEFVFAGMADEVIQN